MKKAVLRADGPVGAMCGKMQIIKAVGWDGAKRGERGMEAQSVARGEESIAMRREAWLAQGPTLG